MRGTNTSWDEGKLSVLFRRGWNRVPKLSIGQRAIFTITPDYGYGAKGYPPIIPGNATLTL
ncbi:11501_t:CDS:2 [Cetraspora pellucida]|uniref:11501_t:CDS:1 n=1 Tax=Cetraspora pellucida TaxID=1433469 RepID=A0ACA9LC70_9GLOM|nr:11501_t:CDS:2 [Cetraspora pellucida]